MSKKKKKTANKPKPQVKANTEEKVLDVNANAEVQAEEVKPASEAQTSTKKAEKPEKNKVVEVKAKDVNKPKKEKVKKPNKMVRAIKNTGSELKKVTWPKFKEVVKQTGVVLVVVIVFALLIFGLDRLCSWLTSFLY